MSLDKCKLWRDRLSCLNFLAFALSAAERPVPNCLTELAARRNFQFRLISRFVRLIYQAECP